ncbi:avidin-like [Pezoporus occidentalis]|uniref:avidin-like n=1 Tax=Pezoporus occidentalis TaxID=407982 RepID=UPI002F9139FE
MGGRYPLRHKRAGAGTGRSVGSARSPSTAAAMGTSGCCLLLALALLSLRSAVARKCNLQGLWRNELGSNMTLLALDAAGTFSGSYHTAVAATNKQILVSPLQGVLQHSSSKGQPTFGFTVQWQFADSITVFTGQCFVDKKGKEVLKTMWLLRSHEYSIEDDWKATMVGTNNFTRPSVQKE